MLDLTLPVVFIHVPKCAGSSVRQYLQKELKTSLILHYRDEKNGHNPAPIAFNDAMDMVSKHGRCVIYGHFNMLRGFGIQHTVPWATQFITILREPFSQFVSTFKYRNRNAAQPLTSNDFEAFLHSFKPSYLNHFPKHIDITNYKSVIRDHFNYIGFYDELNSGMSKISSLLNIKMIDFLPSVNVSMHHDIDFSRYYETFCQLNALEVLAYSFAKEYWSSQRD